MALAGEEPANHPADDDSHSNVAADGYSATNSNPAADPYAATDRDGDAAANGYRNADTCRNGSRWLLLLE